MYYFIEDPTYVLIALALAALACLVALQVTQQGKFLLWALGILGVGLALFGVERFVVTDAERVEAVVYDLADAVRNSNVEAVEALLTPEVTLSRRSETEGLMPIRTLLPFLERVRFDFLKVRQLQTRAGSQTKRGSAEFKVTAGGSADPGGRYGSDLPFAATNTEWSLGFREVSPKVWKITRITAINLPRYASPYIGGGSGR